MIIKGPYLADILDQPKAVRDTLRALEETDPSPVRELVEQGNPSRIVLTGMGTSYHALHPLAIRLTELDWTVAMIETSELLHYYRALLVPGNLIVIVSQSGISAEVVGLLKMVEGRCATIGVTNTPGSALATEADVTILTRAGAEASVSCKTYVATLAVLAWLEDVLGRLNPAEGLRRHSGAPVAMASYLRNWWRHVRSLEKRLDGIENIFLVGRGDSVATAGVGGLIVKESAHFHAEGMSAGAFRHGPFEILSDRVLALVFTGRSQTAELNHRLVRLIREVGGQAELVGTDTRRAAFRLPHVPADLLPYLEILPIQMLTLALASRDGREAGKFATTTKVITTE